MELGPQAEVQLELLADSDNRTIVTVLVEADQSIHVTELADRLVDRETAVVTASEYDQRVEDTILSLHHNRLPRLDEAGLVEYDGEANHVTYRGSPSDTTEWHDVSGIDDLLAHLPTIPDEKEEGMRVIKGRQSVIDYGRQLADEAEDELFCMYVSTDLLEDECVCRAEQALDRGVSMYMGSSNPEVRELTRTQLPEATVWEPQLDWLNTPTYPLVGRLVLIDRRKVMLAVHEDSPPEDPHPDETAVVGDGEDHPLVVLVRELLGPRLDHLDFQSEDFTKEFSM